MSERTKKKGQESSQPTSESLQNFRITKAAIKDMYRDDEGVRARYNKNTSSSSSVGASELLSLSNAFYDVSRIDDSRKYSQEAYAFYPVYATVIDDLSNMFTWDYCYLPRAIKEKASKADFEEIYNLMGEVIDGLSLETTCPSILTRLLVDGAIFLYGAKSANSKTITTLALNPKYCKIDGISQFGTATYLFDFSYFESLSLSKEEREDLFNVFPPEFKEKYDEYAKDKNKKRWQRLNPRFAAALTCNTLGVPTKLQGLFALKRYDTYMSNELERNTQQLDKIIAHKMPTYEDRLVVEIDEMKELHKSMSKVLTKNGHVKMLTTFGDLDVLSIGEDQSKENKTLENGYNSIFDNLGVNNSLYSGATQFAQEVSLKRDESIMWKYVQQIVSFYYLVINNSFNFKGYQCDLKILPITVYNRQDMLEIYRNGATLGVSKLEYLIGLGNKQIDIPSKLRIEEYLQLDKLKPLSTSYTQNDNSQQQPENKKTTNNEDGTTDEGDRTISAPEDVENPADEVDNEDDSN